MGIKSLVLQVRVDIAIRGHNCQANSKHRIEKGSVRLKVRNGRSWDHYCQNCAKTMFLRDIAKLTALQSMTPAISPGD
jgi:hypothetical protein